MLAEVRTPSTPEEEQNQQEELAYLRDRYKYDGVLVVWQGEPPSWLLSNVPKLHADGWRVWFAFGPEEGKAHSQHPHPMQAEGVLKVLSPYLEGLLPTWRGSSLPHDTDKTRVDLVAGWREKAPETLPVGTEYFLRGRTLLAGPYPESGFAVVLNAGVLQIVPSGVLRLLREHTGAPAMVVIVGPRAYWSSYNRLPEPVTVSKAWEIKQQLESRFLREGFSGTITLAGDGSGVKYMGRRFISDVLTVSKCRKQEGESEQ